MKLNKYLSEYTKAIHDPVHGGNKRRKLLELAMDINTFMQETMVEIEDEILEFQRTGGGKEDVRKMKMANDNAHEDLKYLRGMLKELSES
jgi:hypothetical protein